MTPIDPAELSAYLDGELTPERAREIEAALASNPALQAQLRTLADDDARWRAAARQAVIPADIRLPRTPFLPTVGKVLLWGALLLAVRFLPKLAGTLTLSVALNALALALILVWAVALVRSTDRPPVPRPSSS